MSRLTNSHVIRKLAINRQEMKGNELLSRSRGSNNSDIPTKLRLDQDLHQMTELNSVEFSTVLILYHIRILDNKKALNCQID